ncbi:MAG: YajQ family cyclic di-GMP-binding protein [Leptospiraceae bacterium]|nr:YajQ family cyclic di-GMP-binding protein [Leptospiraceae bacterium]MCB1304615.1 YajQ family cyclic di-GMP-binding protein [Leptospiraceae bacterium]
MAEYSFDVACKVDQQELNNAIDQTLKEVNNRFDFKGVTVNIKSEKESLALESSDEMHMKQLIDVLQGKMVKRDLNLKAFDFGEFDTNVSGQVKCKVAVQNGLTQEQCKQINKIIKDTKLKVQSRVQGDAVRVTGKSKDDLQAVMQSLRGADLDYAVTFDNYR